MNPNIRMAVDERRSRSTYAVVVKGGELRRRMTRLGLSTVMLASRARVARGTVSHALNGRPIHPAKLRAIAIALAECEPIPGAEGLIDYEGDDQGREASDG